MAECPDCAEMMKYVDDAKVEADKRGRVSGEPLAEWIGRLPLDVEDRSETDATFWRNQCDARERMGYLEGRHDATLEHIYPLLNDGLKMSVEELRSEIERLEERAASFPKSNRAYVPPYEALAFLLTRIGSWTHARWDQHLRDEYGDEKAQPVIDWLKRLTNVDAFGKKKVK